MKILQLSSYYYPEQVSSSHLTSDLEEAYIDAGFDISIHSPTPTRGVTQEIYEKYKNINYEELHNGHIKVHRFRMFREGRNPVGRALRYILVNTIQYVKGIKEKDVDVIAAGSTPPTQGLLCALVKKRLSKKYGRSVKFVFSLQDVFPDSLVYAGLCRKTSIFYKIGESIMKYTYKNADEIIVITEDFKRMLLEKEISESKIKLIYNWVDENAVINIQREDNPLYEKYNLDKNKFYIAYSGNIGMSQNMDMLLEIAVSLRNRTDIGFILAGDGVYKSTLEQKIREQEIKNITLIPFQDYRDISYVFSLGDVGLIISKAGIANNSVPSKTWSYMSAERPILASFDKNSELCRIIEKNQCGICVEADDAQALKEAILKFCDTPDMLNMGKNGRKFLCENISKEVSTQKYVNILIEATCEKE